MLLEVNDDTIHAVRVFYYDLGGDRIAPPDGEITENTKRRLQLQVETYRDVACLNWRIDVARHCDASIDGVLWHPMQDAYRQVVIDDDNILLIVLAGIEQDCVHAKTATEIMRATFWRYVILVDAELRFLGNFLTELGYRTFLSARIDAFVNLRDALKVVRAAVHTQLVSQHIDTADLWRVLETCQRALKDPELCDAIQGIATMAEVDPDVQHKAVLRLCGLSDPQVSY
jgi:hypothetical protein